MYFLHIYFSLPACGPFPVCNGKIIIVIWESLLYPCRDLESRSDRPGKDGTSCCYFAM